MIRGQHRALHTLKRATQREQSIGSDSVLLLDPPHAPRCARRAGGAGRTAVAELAYLLLDPDDQHLIDMHWQGKTAEIGEVVGAVANTARMRRQRAMARLAQIVLDVKAGDEQVVAPDP